MSVNEKFALKLQSQEHRNSEEQDAQCDMIRSIVVCIGLCVLCVEDAEAGDGTERVSVQSGCTQLHVSAGCTWT